MRLPAATQRRLAVEASVDPRTLAKTLEKALRGEPIRGLSGERARSALARAGLLAPGGATHAPVPANAD
jgi:hypothetical protein